MKKRLFLLMAISSIILIAGCGATENQTVQQTDSNNDQEGNRIVATTVAVTEIMDALEIDLIGIPTSYKELPERYSGLPEVGNPMSPDMELIMSLKPKEVISVTTLRYDLASIFDEANIEARYVNLESLDAMHQEILQIGERYDRQEQAEEIVQGFEDKIKEIEEKTAGKEQPTVLILMGVPGSYLVATEKSYIGDLVHRAGGKNVISGGEVEFLASNTEYLQKSNPDIILRAAHGMPEEVVEMFDEEFKKNDIWQHFNAVKNDRVYDLEELLFGTTGNLAAAEALEELIKMLYP